MHFLHILLPLSALSTAVSSAAITTSLPPEKRASFIPSWEVQIKPGGPTVILNGTIEQVRDELLKLNPNWDEDFPAKQNNLAKRTDFSGYFCGGRWESCNQYNIVQGIDYLRGVSGQPVEGPGPGACGRVSCSYNAAIWWCNDGSETRTLGSFSEIADGASYIARQCTQTRPFDFPLLAGQVFTSDDWNVIVRKDSC